MSYQMVLLAVAVVLGICVIFLQCFKAIKVTKYKNDERWQLVQNKASHVAMHYNSLLGFLICIGFAITSFVDTPFTISLNLALQYLLLAFFFRDTIELIALLHFDKVL
ncbi:hypothetical protein A8L34_08500 [Bacillus sp. FJAT-27264]|uniref:DUF2178 domain-containing protein n=1 Tax=Paenibacillus sp. (strain DSM 101736 / FJAT-27264) TaxID=1850362 RepID=UPI000807CA45|nr:DUF2178 domain-containing protein [Bacillus sp. FJAT-27264]OBZ14005.1 hypothetical protein A8L34_08500 [Bacillus sp. FJAT-27264]